MAAIVLVGAGRMGKAILACAPDTGHRVVAVVRRSASPLDVDGPPVFTRLEEALRAHPGSVVLDVSSASGAAERIGQAARNKAPLVQGTTGLDAAAVEALDAAAARIPVVEAPNMSAGVSLLAAALSRILGGRGPEWDIVVVDRHHVHKKDAPSGTALFLAGLMKEATGREPTVLSGRQGGVTGEHTVYLSGESEELVFTHRALDRSVFARGALLAAGFAATASPGRYGMRDVLGDGEA